MDIGDIMDFGDPRLFGHRFVFRMKNGSLDSTFFFDPVSNCFDIEVMSLEDLEALVTDLFHMRYPDYELISVTRCSLGEHQRLNSLKVYS